MKPICEDIKDLLVAAGYTFGTNLFVSKMPSNNLNVITLFDTSAASPDISLSSDIRNNSFEVLICNAGYQAAYTEAEKVKTALDGLYNFTLNGSNYVLINISNGPNEIPTHSISEDDGKVYLSLNFIAKRKSVVEDESTLKVAEIINSTESFSHDLSFKEVYPLADNEYLDTDGVVKSVPYGEQAVCTIPETQGVDIHNTDNTFEYYAEDGEDVEIPDTIVKNTLGTTILTQPSGTSTGVIADSVVTNSDATFSLNVPAETNPVLADIIHIDTDETPVVYPSAKPFTCTPPVYKWYGIEYDITATSPDVTRINSFGDDDLHFSLPIQSGMRACLLTDAGTVNYWLNPDDWSKKIDGTASDLSGADGMVMIYVPRHYRKFETAGNIYRCKLSMYPIARFHEVPAFYLGAYEASLYRPDLKLASVVNATADYRGGNNNAAWDAQANTLLGKPATNINRTNFRTYARNRAVGTKWNINTYEQHKTITWLFVVEYATRWSQKAVDATLTTEGYKKGGLGAGVTTANGTEWNTFNTYYPFINCGASNSLANKSGEVSVAVTDFGGVGVPRSFAVNRYRGIEMPFGHIWKNLDGVNVDVKTVAQGDYSRMWVTNNPADFNDVNYTNYYDRGLIARASGWIKTNLGGTYGEIVPNVGGTVGGNYDKYWTDYYSPNIGSSSLRTLLVGGTANYGSSAGLVCVGSSSAPSAASAGVGSRLCFIP